MYRNPIMRKRFLKNVLYCVGKYHGKKGWQKEKNKFSNRHPGRDSWRTCTSLNNDKIKKSSLLG
jgi:hypothetical protein